MAACAFPAAAQLGGIGQLLQQFPTGAGRPASEAASARRPAGAASDAGLYPVKPKPGMEDGVKPDLQCVRFEERRDVWQAAFEYGGTEAQLRLDRLVSSNFEAADLKPEDRAMLRYIAYTTVWIPPAIENGFGKAYTAIISRRQGAEAADRSDERQLERIAAQLAALRAPIGDFPGGVELVLDRSRNTGAYSLVGGLIVLSPDFLNRMDESEPIAWMVLAHELSHLYKRHTLKELQYQLITSTSGYALGKKLLARNDPERSSNPFTMARDAWLFTNGVRELVEFVRTNQAAFSVEQEFEADACAVQWARLGHRDPKMLITALAELDAVQPDQPNGYVQTHPSNAARQANLRAATGQGAAGRSAPLPQPSASTSGEGRRKKK